MSSIATHRISIATDDGRVRAIGIRCRSGRIVALHLAEDAAPGYFLRRFDRAAAVCCGDNRAWPARLEIDVVTANCDSPPTTEPIADAADPGGFACPDHLPWRRLAAIERWLIEQAPTDSIRRDVRYFHSLDCWFNRRIVVERGLPEASREDHVPSASALAAAVIDLQQLLLRRLRQRQQGAAAPRLDADAAAAHAVIGPIMHEAARARFRSATPEATTDEALTMFARFGSGELALNLSPRIEGSQLPTRISNGGPDGPMVFAFAEYALLQLEENGDGEVRHLWQRLLAGCVLSAEMYLAAYALHDRDGTVIRRRFAGASSSPASLLRRTSPRSRECLLEMYRTRYGARNGEVSIRALRERLARMLQAAFHPIEGSLLHRLRSPSSHATPPASPGGGAATFPQIPVSDLSAEHWW